MQPAGPTHEIRVHRVLSGWKPHAFTAGKEIRAVVLTELGSSRFQLTGGGARLVVRSSVPFQVGDTVRLQVVSGGPRLRFRFISRTSETGYPAKVLSHYTLPITRNNEFLVETIMRTGASLRETVLRRTVWFLEERKDRRTTDGRLLRALVESELRGIPFDENDPYVGGWFRSRDSRDNGTSEQQRKKDDERVTGRVDLSSQVLGVLTRTTEQADNRLQLWNALRGSGELHWVVVPFLVESPNRNAEAICRLGYRVQSGNVEKVALEIRTSSAEYWFSWNVPPGTEATHEVVVGTRLKSNTGGSSEIGNLLARLGEKYHTVVQSFERFDGYQPVDSSRGYREIDRYE